MMDIFSKVILKLVEVPILKSAVVFLLTFLAFMLGDLYNAEIIGVAMLMVIDFITGLIASKYEGSPIKSRAMSRSVVKALVYYLAIAAGKFLDQSIPGEFVQYSTIGFVAATEFISIMENIGRMGFTTPNKLLNRIKEEYGGTKKTTRKSKERPE